MAAESKRKRIGDIEYEVSQLTWGASNRLFGKLLKTLGATVGAFAGGRMNLLDIDVGPAMTMLARDLGADDVEYIVELLLGNKSIKMATAKGFAPLNMDIWNIHFTGRYFDSMKLLIFALEVNYGDFLDGVRSAIDKQGGAQKDLASSSSSSPTGSTGSSGESSRQLST